MTYRLANISARATLVDDSGDCHDLETLGGPVDPMTALHDTETLHDLAGRLDGRPPEQTFEHALERGLVQTPVPRPTNVFAIGLNYADHVAESDMQRPENPVVFTKFAGCLTGAEADVALRSDHADWEAELVVVIGTGGRDIEPAHAAEHIAGFAIGQDISDRALQFAAEPAHFDLGKSRDTYGPVGPYVVSLDSFDDPWDLAIDCSVNGDTKQSSRTSNMIFDVATLIGYLSAICTLHPGDLIFTGTPDGVGAARTPPVFLRPDDVIVTTIQDIGTITNRCVAG